MTIKEIYLKMILTKYLEEPNVADGGWSSRLGNYILTTLEGIKSNNKKDLEFKDFSNLDFMIDLAKKTKSELLKNMLFNLPGMREDFNYVNDTKSQYMFVMLDGKYYNDKEGSLDLKYNNEYNFKFEIDVELFVIKMTYGDESFLSRDIIHLINIRDFIVKNEIKSELINSKEISLKAISEQVKIMNY